MARIQWPTALVATVAILAAAAVLLFAPPDVREWALAGLATVAPVVLALMRGLLHAETPPEGKP